MSTYITTNLSPFWFPIITLKGPPAISCPILRYIVNSYIVYETITSVSRQYRMYPVASMIFVLLAISFVGVGSSESLAQGTNNTINATGVASATSAGAGGQTTIIMLLGSSVPTSGAGYKPPTITVSPGATVIWDNQDNALHTATSGNPDIATPDGKFDTSLVGANQQSKPVTLPADPGEYSYFCTLHPWMSGKVIVS
jgi:plastocyanin